MKDKKCPKCKICKPITEFSKDKSRKSGYQTYCKKCRKHYYKNNVDKVAGYRNSYYQQWLEFIEVDRLRCSVCGYNKSFAALDFHHNDPTIKNFEIGWFMGRPATEKNKRILSRELSKCIILCSNCHREFHAKNY